MIRFDFRLSDMTLRLSFCFKFHDNFLEPGKFSHHFELILLGLLFVYFLKPDFWVLKLLNNLFYKSCPDHFIFLELGWLHISQTLLFVGHFDRSLVRASWIILMRMGLKGVNILWTVSVINVVPTILSLVNILPVHQQVIDVPQNIIFAFLNVCCRLHITHSIACVCAIEELGLLKGCLLGPVRNKFRVSLALRHIGLFASASVFVIQKFIPVTLAWHSRYWLSFILFVNECLLWLLIGFERNALLFLWMKLGSRVGSDGFKLFKRIQSNPLLLSLYQLSFSLFNRLMLNLTVCKYILLQFFSSQIFIILLIVVVEYVIVVLQDFLLLSLLDWFIPLAWIP